MARRFDFQYYCSEGFHSIFTHGFMSFAAVCMIVACLLIMGSFSLVAVNLNHMLGDLEDDNLFLAYVDENYTEEEARALQSQIEAVPNVGQVTFVTRAEALDDFRAGREDNPLLADLPDEVLRDRFEIHVDDIEQLQATSEQVDEITGIADVNAAYDIAQGFVMVRNIAAGVAIVLVTMLAVVSLFIIANTIKLAFFYRREEIAIMKMCGATNAFIRWPFDQRPVPHHRSALYLSGVAVFAGIYRGRSAHRRGGLGAGHSKVFAGIRFRGKGAQGMRPKKQRIVMGILAVVMVIALILPMVSTFWMQ